MKLSLPPPPQPCWPQLLWPPPAAYAGPEEDFLKVIADGGITWLSGKTQMIINAGHAVCDD